MTLRGIMSLVVLIPCVLSPMSPPSSETERAATLVVDESMAARDDVAMGGADESLARGQDDARVEALASYVLDAMTRWNSGPVAGAVTRMPAIASDIAVVALHGPRIWPGSDGAREALLLAAIGFWESRFRDYVDDGRCNRWASRARQRNGRLNLKTLSREAQALMQMGSCDGGLAVGIGQVHFTSTGFAITNDGRWMDAAFVRNDGSEVREIVTREKAMQDRRALLRVMLTMARRSLQAGAGLCQYTGEPGPCPKANARLEFAERYSRMHPFGSGT